ncbi:MAG: flavodoxin family protein [Planctomycetes bacterium]|nr:flavodoxin family protein [Planctomycetota bacterium]
MRLRKTGDCIIKDEMTPIYNKLLKADLVVLAAPIFFYGLPAQTKALIDRCQSLWARKYILKRSDSGKPKRRGFFISVGGTKGENLFTGAALTVKYFFKAIDVDYADDLLYRQVDAKGAIRNHPSALKEAFQAGQEMATSF